jgi:hypothetical protein
MQKNARTDAPGVLHHLIGRRVEGRDVFVGNADVGPPLLGDGECVRDTVQQMGFSYVSILLPARTFRH